MRTRSRCFALVATCLLASVCFAADKKKLLDATAAVDANLKTAAGKQYDEALGKDFGPKYSSSVKPCLQAAPAATRSDPFDLLLKLSADGKVEEGLVYPDTQVSICVRSAFGSAQFSPPPHNDYWINIHMEFKH